MKKEFDFDLKKQSTEKLFLSHEKASTRFWETTPYTQHTPYKIFEGSIKEFITYLEQNVLFVTNPISRSIFIDFFMKNSEQEKDGVYYKRHLPKNYNNKLHFIINYPKSSELWWNNIEKYITFECKSLNNFSPGIWATKIKEIDNDSEYEDIWELSHFKHIPLLSKRRKNSTGSHEIPSEDFWMLKNVALHIEGWDPFDPPVQFVSLGGPAGLPRFSEDVDAGSGCLLTLKCSDGSVVNYTIVDGGKNHKVRDVIDAQGSTGQHAEIFVTDTDSNGKITDSQLINPGSGYGNISDADILSAFQTKTMLPEGIIRHKHPDLFLFAQKGFGYEPQ